MINVKDTHSSFLFVQNAFKKNKRIFYSRFGDGDVYIMMGRDQAPTWRKSSGRAVGVG
ncbi:MAG: hypothetical protein L0Y35_04565 [Flammeovirgaceae bacterium]|nr:hypothetical protein [Flammeovirgaceae bacterium]